MQSFMMVGSLPLGGTQSFGTTGPVGRFHEQPPAAWTSGYGGSADQFAMSPELMAMSSQPLYGGYPGMYGMTSPYGLPAFGMGAYPGSFGMVDPSQLPPPMINIPPLQGAIDPSSLPMPDIRIPSMGGVNGLGLPGTFATPQYGNYGGSGMGGYPMVDAYGNPMGYYGGGFSDLSSFFAQMQAQKQAAEQWAAMNGVYNTNPNNWGQGNGQEAPLSVRAHAYNNGGQQVPVREIRIWEVNDYNRRTYNSFNGDWPEQDLTMPNARVGQTYRVQVTWADGTSETRDMNVSDPNGQTLDFYRY